MVGERGGGGGGWPEYLQKELKKEILTYSFLKYAMKSPHTETNYGCSDGAYDLDRSSVERIKLFFKS